MYKVYWTDETGNSCFQDFEEMKLALDWTQFLRGKGRTFVTMVSENPNSVGKPGVDSVEDGVLPNGEAYTWKMRRTQ
jgi:hypothetical protein